ncbi:methyltransferase domain-containing protein [Mycolicibacterium sp. P9-64]|uniref:class I SAM-dependent methyltransferase n=1 Tax=Mycolicibacterium sp. P9-64 TaxID=2024612 RepID=UPI0011EE78D3|nr:methyltransferase domain-containing protein [Mycolicibacterium sp. P9-64]KAA0079108.1 methyltransferase domain-containing protein [Mycolicibacterium sp. P9-64]
MGDVLRHFVHANASLSGRIQPSMVKKTHAYTKYDEAGTALLEREPRIVLDVGAGRQWHFDPSLKGQNMKLIGFDIDHAEMADNALLDQRISGDACQSLGVPDHSVDLIMGRAVVEHLHDTASFLKSANRALSEDGCLIVTFANRYAPFAILNRLLPRRVSRWLLMHLVPGSSGVLGFQAFYDQAGFREFKRSLAEAGFEIEEEYASYFATSYYGFFLPLFFVGLGLDYVRYALADPRLASYFMFIARKQSLAN